MTLIIRPGEVINTETTEVIMGGQIRVGGNFRNDGITNVNNTGNLEVVGNISNTNQLNVGEKQNLVRETVKTVGKAAEFGTEILKKLPGKK